MTLLMLIDAVACAVIVMGILERARTMIDRRGVIDRLAVVLIGAGALGLFCDIVAHHLVPSVFDTLLLCGLALHYGAYLVCHAWEKQR